MIAQERPQAGLDRLGFPFRSHEAQEEVVGIAYVLEAAIVRVVRYLRRHLCQDTAQLSIGRHIPLSFGDTPLVAQSRVLRVDPLGPTLRVVRDERLLDVLVEPVEVDVREQRAGDSALWRATERGPMFPLFEVSGLEHVLDESDEAVVEDFLADDRQQDLMIDVVKRNPAMIPLSTTRLSRPRTRSR